MNGNLVLSNPILIDGRNVRTLPYDTDEITGALYIEACTKASAISKSGAMSYKLRQNDYALHVCLGWAAVMAKSAAVTMADVDRVKGNDILTISDIGLFFTLQTSEDSSQESDSDEPCEITQNISTPALPTSNDGD